MPVSNKLYHAVREAVMNAPIHGDNGYLDMDLILKAALRQAVPLAEREFAMRVQREVAEIVDALLDDTNPKIGEKITHAIMKREDDWCPDGMIITEGKYAGKLFGAIPTAYLEWMVREKTELHQLAKNELKARGTNNG